jgi:hypothetical protein
MQSLKPISGLDRFVVTTALGGYSSGRQRREADCDRSCGDRGGFRTRVLLVLRSKNAH